MLFSSYKFEVVLPVNILKIGTLKKIKIILIKWNSRALDKRDYLMIIFLISHRNYML